MKRVYQSFSRVCRAESNVTQESIDKFNDGEDFDNLPDDRPLKCFMMCQMVHMEMLDPLIPAVRFETVIENISIFTDEDRDIFVKMGRKCTKLRNKTKDACELAYLMNKCLKKGDINVSCNQIAAVRCL